jgi:hypothetical protein
LGGLVGSDGVVDLAEPVDFDGEGVAVVDGSAVEVLILEGAEEPLDDAVGPSRQLLVIGRVRKLGCG